MVMFTFASPMILYLLFTCYLLREVVESRPKSAGEYPDTDTVRACSPGGNHDGFQVGNINQREHHSEWSSTRNSPIEVLNRTIKLAYTTLYNIFTETD